MEPAPSERQEVVEELVKALEACYARLHFIHGRLVPHNYATVADPELHNDVHNIQRCINMADRALNHAKVEAITWTTDKPKQARWYWYRLTPNATPFPVKIFDANQIVYVWPVNDHGSREENITMRLSDCNGEFAGPLEPPA